MPEHKIRLRAAWEADFVDNANTITPRLNLPIIWSDRTSFPARLRRPFNAPRYDADREALFLCLQNCGGTVGIWLDGKLHQRVSKLANSTEVALPLLSASRHLLELELAFETLEPDLLSLMIARPWGEIALVFRALPGPPHSLPMT